MYSSGVWSEYHENGEVVVGVTDYYVEEFGDSEWEWSACFNKENAKLLENTLRKEFEEELTLKEMIATKFGNHLDTIGFVKYLDEHGLKYFINRTC